LNLQLDTQSKTQAKRSSSETLLKRSAPGADRNGILIEHAKILPELISDLLRSGKRVRFRAPGYSMYPTILNGDEITVEPIKPDAIKVGDIFLYRDQESLIAHRVVKIEIKNETQSSILSPESCFTLRGDARPACDDPVAAEQVLGKVVRIETNGRGINPYSFKAKLIFIARRLVFRLKRFMN